MNIATNKKKTFDLGAFDNVNPGIIGAPISNASTKRENQVNVVLAIPLSQIIEDENQPRKNFNSENWDDFVADIKKHGVRNPIHVRPAVNGIYKIINGARRYRGSLQAGLNTIPCIIQEDENLFDDYAQVLDNISNEEMSPVDIALFIQKRLAAGDSKGLIAENLSVKNNYVTHHLALLNMPAVVQNAYAAGKITGARSVYELNKLFSENPEVAKSVINSNDEITNAIIIQARKSLTDIEVNDANTGEIVSVVSPGQNSIQQSLNNEENEKITEAIQDSVEESPVNDANTVDSGDYSEPANPVEELPYHNPNNEESTAIKQTDPNKIKKPLLLAYYQGNQACVVMLHERPSASGFIWIKLEDTGEKIEALADTIQLNLLTEAKGKE